MGVTERERLAPDVFRLPVEKIREGYYSDVYFNYAKATLELDGRHPRALMQVFQRKDSILGGVDEALAVIRQCAGRRRPDGSWEDGWDQLEVNALHEGDEIEPWETVMTIEGDYSLFAHLETVYLGCMARRTLVMHNVREVVDAAGGKPIIYFPARHDHWLVQTGDGWAAHVAGAIGVSTDAQASWWGGRGIGTVPHGLIAAYGGDTVAASRAFVRGFGDQMQVTVLVDFQNDSVRTALEVAEALDGSCGASGSTPPTASPTSRCRPSTATRPRTASTPSWSSSSATSSTATASRTSRSSSPAASTRSASGASRRRTSPSTPTASGRR